MSNVAKIFTSSNIGINTFNTLSFAKYSPYKLAFSRKPKLLLDVETTPDIKALGTFKIILC